MSKQVRSKGMSRGRASAGRQKVPNLQMGLFAAVLEGCHMKLETHFINEGWGLGIMKPCII